MSKFALISEPVKVLTHSFSLGEYFGKVPAGTEPMILRAFSCSAKRTA